MATHEQTAVRSIVPCLVFNDGTEEAINLYVSTFKNSRIVTITRSDAEGPVAQEKVLHAGFELDGREFTAFGGGPYFRFSEGPSLMATVS